MRLGYANEMAHRPQTLYAIRDSPVGRTIGSPAASEPARLTDQYHRLLDFCSAAASKSTAAPWLSLASLPPAGSSLPFWC